MYSDDTQLRLSVCRCLRADGRFDVEAFSKIELPALLSYGLGVGLGTKAAAQALGRKATRWNSNFFNTNRSVYVNGGGNGAAMRIQPHVWASRSPRPASYLPSILRDVVCTHGHPRAILGAALHALAIGTSLKEGSIPDPKRWEGMATFLGQVPQIMEDDEDLADRWLPIWEKEAGRTFQEASAEVLQEVRGQLVTAGRAAKKGKAATRETYSDLAENLGGMNPKTRGSGVTTAVLSLWLAWRCEDDAGEASRIAANLIGSDTDTVATMAAALAGPFQDQPPPGPLVDEDLHIREATRAEEIAVGNPVGDFAHPDPLHFKAPTNFTGFIGRIEDVPALAGLGPITLEGDLMLSPRGQDGWQWARTEFGQLLLVKRKPELPRLGSWATPRPRLNLHRPDGESSSTSNGGTEAGEEFIDRVAEAVRRLEAARFDPFVFKEIFEGLALGPNGPAMAGYFGALVAERLAAIRQG